MSDHQYAQFILWEANSPNINVCPFYDLIPKFVIGKTTDSRNDLPIQNFINHKFSFENKNFDVILQPCHIIYKKTHIKLKYLGFREQIIEDTIRRISSENNRLCLVGDNVRCYFLVNELRDELSRINHTYSLGEIMDAISILNGAIIRVFDASTGDTVMSSPVFPVVNIRGKNGYDKYSYVEFNSTLSQSIKKMDFLCLDYDFLMRIRNPVSRWLLKKLWVDIYNTKKPIYQISIETLHNESGIHQWKNEQKTYARVNDAVLALKSMGIIDYFESNNVLWRREKSPIVLSMSVTPDFMTKIHSGHQTIKASHHLQNFIKQARDVGDFVKIPHEYIFRYRAEKNSTPG